MIKLKPRSYSIAPSSTNKESSHASAIWNPKAISTGSLAEHRSQVRGALQYMRPCAGMARFWTLIIEVEAAKAKKSAGDYP